MQFQFDLMLRSEEDIGILPCVDLTICGALLRILDNIARCSVKKASNRKMFEIITVRSELFTNTIIIPITNRKAVLL